MRGGYYTYHTGNLDFQSSYGSYWSRRLNNVINGYYLGFYSGYVNPQFSNLYRGYGFTIRCLHARTTPILAPLSLVRGGYYSYYYGILNYQSSRGSYWSRRLTNASYGYGLVFINSSDLNFVNPQYSSDRGSGFSLRCLALGKTS